MYLGNYIGTRELRDHPSALLQVLRGFRLCRAIAPIDALQSVRVTGKGDGGATTATVRTTDIRTVQRNGEEDGDGDGDGPWGGTTTATERRTTTTATATAKCKNQGKSYILAI